MGSFDKFGQCIQLLARVACTALRTNGSNVFGRIEHAESLALSQFGNVVEGHAETNIGFVRSVFRHRFVPCDARKVSLKCFSENRPEQVFCQFFERSQNIFAVDERHLAIDLCEFGLPVGPQVLIAEAADDLEVAIVAGYHQQLLEGLRRLRQCVEFTRIHSRGDDKVTCTLRRRLDQIWGLDLQKAFAVEKVADFVSHLVTQNQRLFQRIASQVEKTVLHPQFVTTVAVVFDREGGCQ